MGGRKRHIPVPPPRGITRNEADPPRKKTINLRKINQTLVAMASQARSHQALELINGENQCREILHGGSIFAYAPLYPTPPHASSILIKRHALMRSTLSDSLIPQVL